MFERYLSDALTTHFGHLVENLDADKVRISAWNGELVLKDLYLRRDALEKALGTSCPVEIEYGKVGHLELRIPWSLVRSQLTSWQSSSSESSLSKNLGCTVLLSDVNILITPKRDHGMQESDDAEISENDLSLEERRIRKEEQVQRKIDETLFRQVAETLQQPPAKAPRRWDWARRLATNLVSSLGVTVTNIHVRYEDPGTCLGFVWSDRQPRRHHTAFSIGITLRQFSVQTTDGSDDQASERTKLDAAFSIRRKLAAAYQLAVYWDRGSHLLSSDVPGFQQMEKVYFSNAFGVLNREDQQHSHVLFPVSPALHFSLVGPNEETVSADAPPEGPPGPLPPSSVTVSFPSCHFEVTRTALEDAAYLRKSLSAWRDAQKGLIPYATVQAIARLRPSNSPKYNPRGWWLYTFEATTILLKTSRGEDPVRVDYQASLRKKRGWLGLSRALAERKQYIRLYLRLLSGKDETEKTEAHLALLDMEDGLTAEEIVAFRMAVCHNPSVMQGYEEVPSRDSGASLDSSDDILDAAMPTRGLTVEQRCKLLEELARVLRTESIDIKLTSKHDVTPDSERVDLQYLNNVVIWKSELIFSQLSLQLNEKTQGSRTSASPSSRPIVDISCAVRQVQHIYGDGGWEVDCAIASLGVKDLTNSSNVKSPARVSRQLFPHLLTTVDGLNKDSVEIGGASRRLSASINVRRVFSRDGSVDFATTRTTIRLRPLEVVYSTNPIASLSRLFSSVRTPEFVDDYHRLASVAHRWREKQRLRLLQALAHRQKKIFIDVDVFAPVILIPEDLTDEECPLLVMDLGRLKFFNTDQASKADFDDSWTIRLDDIQVQSSSIASYRTAKVAEVAASQILGSVHQMVEPFSLQLLISSRFGSLETRSARAGVTKIVISATLPRLVFNLTSSAVRLVKRLQNQWKRRQISSERLAQKSFIEGVVSLADRTTQKPTTGRPARVARTVQFEFSAPFIALNLENDVDGREYLSLTEAERDRYFGRIPTTPLVDLVLSGTRGSFIQNVDSTGTHSITFDASLHSVQALDLYQQAGNEYSSLLSSFLSDPTRKMSIDQESVAELQNAIGTDLVSIKFTTVPMPADDGYASKASAGATLSIRFNELYVEWNPDTIAALNKAVMLPADNFGPANDLNQSLRKDISEQADSDEEFFDAIEYSEDSSLSLERNDSDSHFRLISEVSSSRASSFSDAAEILVEDAGGTRTAGLHSLSPFRSGAGRPSFPSGISTAFIGMGSPPSDPVIENAIPSEERKPASMLRIIFGLSKLRVHFNKETRKRRLFTAEMGDTNVEYVTKDGGGSRTVARIGNLSIYDASSADSTTLYGEILRPKLDSFARSDGSTSVLELELTMSKKSRTMASRNEAHSGDRKIGSSISGDVIVDLDNGTASGSDFSLNLHFSPMRFVYLQQLWLEISDYFFEGVVGSDVWGRPRPPVASLVDGGERVESVTKRDQGQPLARDTEGVDGTGVSFTKVNITMVAPVIVVPVAYRSPQFMRLEFSSLEVANHYTGQELSVVPATKRVQWFNNYVITLQNLMVSDWLGKSFTSSSSEEAGNDVSRVTNARFVLNWPTGPGAALILPKWNVTGDVDALRLFLRRDDYTLLQHVISYNIGELSRNLEEWNAFQSLPSPEIEKYERTVMVKFGYDKKDVTPSTYRLRLSVPSLSFVLTSSQSNEEVIAQAHCTQVDWTMKKSTDRVVHQRVTCNVCMSGSSDDVNLLLPPEQSSDVTAGRTGNDADDVANSDRMLSYTSTTTPSGDNLKKLEIFHGTIHFIYPAWMAVKKFFSSLGLPRMMLPEEIKNSIQIGDRWYPMGSSVNAKQTGGSPVSLVDGFVSKPRSSYQFRLLLTAPRIVLSAGTPDGDRASLILCMAHFDFLHSNMARLRQMKKSFFVHGLEVYISSGDLDSSTTKASLIHPWNVTGIASRCAGAGSKSCEEHSMSISTDVMRARAAYSDMSRAIDVVFHLLSEMHVVKDTSSALETKTESAIEEAPALSNNVATNAFCVSPEKETFCIGSRGFELTVIDDSLRHFADAQELILLSVGNIAYAQQSTNIQEVKTETCLRLTQIDMLDCLQSSQSPFRLAVTSRIIDDEQPDQVDEGQVRSKGQEEMAWTEFRSSRSESLFYEVPEALSKRIDFLRQAVLPVTRSSSAALTSEGLVEFWSSRTGASRQLDACFHSLTLKWNPSTVIALQRFLGRLLKKSKGKMLSLTGPVFSGSPPLSSESKGSATVSEVKLPVHAKASIGKLTLYLNKEHQGRMLLRMRMSGNKVRYESDNSGGWTVAGSIRDVNAWDSDSYELKPCKSIVHANRQVLQVLSKDLTKGKGSRLEIDENFFRFHYRTFSKRAPATPDSLPPWVNSLIVNSDDGPIDDYLSISVASLQLNYIRERSEEIIDYLSNGLPGKGMGATSRAAKGFINKRIQTRSFLDLSINAPRVQIPREEEADCGLLVRLGDVKVRSWFEASKSDSIDSSDLVWSRALSFSLRGLGWDTYGNRRFPPTDADDMSCMVPVDLYLSFRKPRVIGKAVTVQGKLSSVEMTLSYTAYTLVRAVIKNNIGRKIDDTLWDNVEKAYWMQEVLADEPSSTVSGASVEEEGVVSYAASARIIRYGKKKIQKSQESASEGIADPTDSHGPSSTSLDMSFELEGLAVSLRRDDDLDLDHPSVDQHLSDMLSYDMVLFRVERIEISATKNRDGDKSLHVSMYSIGLYDLGDRGRLAREQFYQNLKMGETNGTCRPPSAFVIIAEGRSDRVTDQVATPQLVLTVDTCPSSSVGLVGESNTVAESCDKVTVARVMINDLTVNALFRPLLEIRSFMNSSWPTVHLSKVPSPASYETNQSHPNRIPQPIVRAAKDSPTEPKNDASGFQLKIVAHYPHVFFVADESDLGSRALVLRGLANINGSVVKQVKFIDKTRGFVDSIAVSSMDAQFHRMESYINADVSGVLGLRPQHSDIIGHLFDSSYFNETVSIDPRRSTGLGVALIEPVTFGVQASRTDRDRFPSRRFVNINMDPVSTMLSFEDLSLIETVLERWSSKRSKKNLPDVQREAGPAQHKVEEDRVTFSTATRLFDVVFQSRRLGLVLKRVSNSIVVESITHVLDDLHGVQNGDVLKAINDVPIRTRSLEKVVQDLADAPRPVKLTFSRQTFDVSVPSDTLEAEESGKVKEDIVDVGASQTECFTMELLVGAPIGLSLEKHDCGNVPVIVDADLELLVRAYASDSDEEVRFPQTGAIITYVDSTPALRLGFNEALDTIHRFESPDTSTAEGNVKAEAETALTYIVTFVELDSSMLGVVDDFVLSVSRVDLTLIDDVKGRDMPLLRGRLHSLDVQIERGLGLKANLIEAFPPSFLSLGRTGLASLDQAYKDASLSYVHKVGAVARIEADYFHPKIAAWEPVLEPSQLCFGVEWQEGNAVVPGRLAVELSDRFLHTQKDKYHHLADKASSVGVISVNLTETAVEVFARALHEWREWRQDAVERVKSNAGSTATTLTSSINTMVDHAESAADAGNGQSSKALPSRTVGGDNASTAVAQRAAQAALNFATRRGAGTRKPTERGTPFLFRNQTGVALSLEQQTGFGRCETISVSEGGEVQFHVTVASDTEAPVKEDFESSSEAHHVREQKQNRVRTYEGHHPGLSVTVASVAGYQIGQLRDLPMFKVGRTVHYLSVKGSAVTERRRPTIGVDIKEHESSFFVPVVWTVELQDNRRIVTLSSAAKVLFEGEESALDIGIGRDAPTYAESIEILQLPPEIEQSSSDEVGSITLRSVPSTVVEDESPDLAIRRVGVAKPGIPFFLPLWLALSREPNYIYIRPHTRDCEEVNGGVTYHWSRHGILAFQSVDGLSAADGKAKSGQCDTWAWTLTFDKPCFLSCIPGQHTDKPLTGLRPLWYACYSVLDTQLPADLAEAGLPVGDEPSQALKLADVKHSEDVSIVIESCFTFRNFLPTNLQWETASRQKGEYTLLGGSTPISEGPALSAWLSSGESADVLPCNFKQMETHVRVRLFPTNDWSKWTQLPRMKQAQRSVSRGEVIGEEEPANSREAGREKRIPPMARQVNVQLQNDFGVPLTIGLRVIPKFCGIADGSFFTYGVDVVAHAELWLRNLTALPLVFGCASHQVHEPIGSGSAANDDSDTDAAAKVTAEAALSEIASVFEMGDRGKGLRSQSMDNSSSAVGDVEFLPFQSSGIRYHEVFEYIEIEGSTVKKRWWASDNYNSWRKSPMDTIVSGETWQWIDDAWSIDCTGDVRAEEGGWESCRSLLGGSENFFSGRRSFNPSHSFRRRRWFRRLISRPGPLKGQFLGKINAFHQPIADSFTRSQKIAARKARERKQADVPSKQGGPTTSYLDEGIMQISVRCGDGRWSSPCLIPAAGRASGIARVFGSRWPTLTKISGLPSKFLSETVTFPSEREEKLSPRYSTSTLSSELFELCYRIVELEGEWGELSRLCLLTPRFILRNDSRTISFEVKQTGAPNETSILLRPGAVSAFYWADFRLPELLSLRPINEASTGMYRWSGGLDIARLGMTPVRVRPSRVHSLSSESGDVHDYPEPTLVKSVRTLVEIRTKTGGFGINISFREEDPNGNGSLFRIENLSPFPIWLGQDGMLANPGIREAQRLQGKNLTWDDEHPESEGDCVGPRSRTAFALDVPYRQGKYAHRKAATMAELLRVRVALAPLHSREGIETTKLVGLTEIGEAVRLNPSKLSRAIGNDLASDLSQVRVLGVVATDGPTRVLRFCLMRKDGPAPVLKSPPKTPSATEVVTSQQSVRRKLSELTTKAASEASLMMSSGQILSEGEAKRMAYFGRPDEVSQSIHGTPSVTAMESNLDRVFSFRASFTGFTCSLIDSVPSEIAVATLKNVNALARWNSNRTTDGSVVVSIGWLQVDNHVPNAPFPVAVSPDRERGSDEIAEEGDEAETKESPLLLVGLTFAPQHKSGILCLRSATIAPRNIAIAVDLAFIVRLQRFFVGLKECAKLRLLDEASPDLGDAPDEPDLLQLHPIPFPDIDAIVQQVEGASAMGVESRKMYFEGFTILPCKVSLSVAPARALTPNQAALEGPETAAIHAAVRKGDLLLRSGTLGVRVGRKNKTALAVFRGVFKSIVVDALLRCDDASLNFTGVFLRNHFASLPQLRTQLGTHYLASLRNNLPALLGSLSAFGNPLGLLRGLGDGMSDFVLEPVKGLKRSMQELDPFFVVDGVARGTGSLARHAVGGFADSASMLTETFSKNMAVLTLDRRYAQRRDRGDMLRDTETNITLVEGVESGVAKLVRGILEGVTGVIRAPIRGAEKKGVEGFAKGIGKGLLGLLVKPVIGLSDAATDVMIGVKGSVEGGRSGMQRGVRRHQVRPRRPFYGHDRVLRPYDPADAAAAALMLRTRLAGEYYLSHCDMGDRVALLSVKRVLVLDQNGKELLMVKFSQIKSVEVHSMKQEDGSDGWGIVIVLSVSRKNGSEVEVVSCKDKKIADDLCNQINQGVSMATEDT